MTSAADFTCHDDGPRRALVRARENLNGLDYLEVSSNQRRLTMYFLDKAPAHLQAGNVRISGGRRIRGDQLRVLHIDVCRNQDPERDDCLTIDLDRPGDFSCYTLCLVEADGHGRPTDIPLAGFDPRYRCLDFDFKAGCPSDLDCAAGGQMAAPRPAAPVLDYLARDYATFRQLILDRLALNVPDWSERHVPDLGITLAELLAYVGDHLSYQQDVVATEAYLDTANQRISVRRHARLVDYVMHEGCAARALVCLRVSQNVTLNLSGVQFITGLDEWPVDRPIAPGDFSEIPANAYEAFEALGEAQPNLYEAHNEIHFYTWKQRECCLSQGATQATLLDGWESASAPTGDAKANGKATSASQQRKLHLRPGDLLIFEEVRSPRTGSEHDADPARRHAVRLIAVEEDTDPLNGQPLVQVTWHVDDALPFPLCLSAQGPDCDEIETSVASGNVVLVGHGRTVHDCLGTADLPEVIKTCDCGCGEPLTTPGRRFRPTLAHGPLVYREAATPGHPSAQRLLQQNSRAARPDLSLESWPVPTLDSSAEGDPCTVPRPDHPRRWTPVPDLLSSTAKSPVFVVEVDDDGNGHLRFGDDQQGRAPGGGDVFHAQYRVGGGAAGNVGADAIRHLIGSFPSGLGLDVRNPLPASGGQNPESVAEVRQFAPYTFRNHLERAITPEDYVAITQREFPEVQRAAARLIWTGSGYAVQLAVDMLGQAQAAPELLRHIQRRLQRYQKIGHDLEVRAAELIPIDLRLTICVHPHFLQAHVRAGLLRRLGNGLLPGGLGYFHPDNLSFGQGITTSGLMVAARSIQGVDDVQVTRLQRYAPGAEPSDLRAVSTGLLRLGAFQIAQLDNDPSFPEHGVLKLDLRGGR